MLKGLDATRAHWMTQFHKGSTLLKSNRGLHSRDLSGSDHLAKVGLMRELQVLVVSFSPSGRRVCVCVQEAAGQ